MFFKNSAEVTRLGLREIMSWLLLVAVCGVAICGMRHKSGNSGCILRAYHRLSLGYIEDRLYGCRVVSVV